MELIDISRIESYRQLDRSSDTENESQLSDGKQLNVEKTSFDEHRMSRILPAITTTSVSNDDLQNTSSWGSLEYNDSRARAEATSTGGQSDFVCLPIISQIWNVSPE
jgi:hypothetical protein